MILLIIILLIVLLFFVVLYGTDLFMNKFSEFRRFHIGRWKSHDDWSSAVENKAIQWLKHTPTVKQTDNCRYVLIDMLKGSYRNETIQSWQIAGLVLGLSASDRAETREAVANWKKTLLDNKGNWKRLIYKVDFAMLAYALLKSTSVEQYEEIRPAMAEVVKMIESHLTSEGIISYSEGKNANRYFVDTLGMVCPFLSLYGRIYHKPQYTRLALKQLHYFSRNGMLEQTMLPCHAIDADSHLPLSLFGWGRGTAWYVFGLIDSYSELEDSNDKEELRQFIISAANSYKVFQNTDGGFCTILQGGGVYESSVTAVMAYFYRVCAEVFGNSEYKAVSDRCLERLMKATMRDGAIDCCQGDTHGIGSFSQTFDIMPFAQGMALRGIRVI